MMCQQDVQESGQLLLTSLINSLATFYPLQACSPSSCTNPSPERQQGGDADSASGTHGLRVEAWGEFRYRNGVAVFEAPAFHSPSAEEVSGHP